MEKLVAITTGETVGIKIKCIENIYEDTEGLNIKTTESTFRNVTEINGNRCENVEDIVSFINDVIEGY